MTTTITVYIDSDAGTLGPDATQDDLDRYAQNLANHLAAKFPGRGEIEIEQRIGGASQPGRVCPQDEEIEEYVIELHSSDGWVELLGEAT